MTASDTFVIAGAGLAGGKAVEALREQGFDGRIVLVGSEVHLPYERPPLSKDYLAGRAEHESFQVHDAAWFEEHDVELMLGASVLGFDPAAHVAELTGGEELTYTKLLLATGSSPRQLSIPGTDAAGVHYLRTVGDSDRIRTSIGDGDRFVVIGAGWIGLEVAATARQAGRDVTVLEAAELPLLRVLGPEVARVFAGLHEDNGVDLRFGVTVEAIETADGGVTGVRLGDGTVIPADAVVIGIGAAPNTEVAETAGLTVDNGVVVDASLRTSDPDVYAVGDIARFPYGDKQIRVEHWAAALNQPATAAAAMLGKEATYDELPYFFTDQFDLGMEYLGYVEPDGYASVVFRGDVAAREFIAFWVSSDNQVLAGMNVNVWDVTDPIKAIIRSGKSVDLERLADPEVPLDQI
ncbi:MAG TPA: FAD-dependent oxidoreductase [Pseudonocardiaceae bacterium]|nr:FAD-dependent oxidoreductase [Pseudonocardiaceae bacterium]